MALGKLMEYTAEILKSKKENQTYDRKSARLKMAQNHIECVRSQIKERTFLGQDGKFVTIPEYPEFAWKELIVNAITHRDYSIKGTDAIKLDKSITIEMLSKTCSVEPRTIERNIKKMREKGILMRVDPDFGGHWQINL